MKKIKAKDMEKTPFDYYDFFNYQYYEGLERLAIAKMFKGADVPFIPDIFELLAQGNLRQMKIMNEVITK